MSSHAKVVAALAAALLGSANAHAKEVTIGFSLDSKDSTLQTAWEDYLRSEGVTQGKAAGLEIKWVINVANADSTRQAANIEDLINRGVDVILARALDSAAIGASIKAAKAAKIPFITFDRKSSSAQPLAHVGGDSYDQGLTTGLAMGKILKAHNVKGKCIELQGALTDVNAIVRSKGWAESGVKTGAYETVVKVPTEWNPELFLSGLTNALKAHPEANCVFTASDFAFPSIQAALEKADRWYPTGHPKHMWLGTCDLLTAAVKPMENGYIDASVTWDAYEQAKEAVRVAIAAAKGQDPKCGTDGCLAKGRLVTQENIKTIDNLWSRKYQ
jgi:ribose transport system substrate-binding protein